MSHERAHERKLNIVEAAEHTGFTRNQITRAAKSTPPRLKAYWLGEFGPLAFTATDLDDWVASMANTGPRRNAKARANAANARAHKTPHIEDARERTTAKAGAR